MDQKKTDIDTYSFRDAIGMFIGAEAGLGIYILISTYLLYFYTNVIGLNIAVCGILIGTSKLFDGITDVFFGFVIDRTKSKLGACRSWTLRICIPYAIMSVLLFLVPANSGVWPYVYVFITYNLMVSVCKTIGDISENTLPTYITRNAKGRGLLFTCKGLSAGIAAYVVSNYTMTWVGMLGGDRTAWIKLSIIIALVGILTQCIMVMLTKERVVMENMTKNTRPKIVEVLKAVAHNKYWIMVTVMLCMGSCIQAGTAGIAAYYARYVLGNIALVGTVLSAFLLPPLIGFLLAGILMQKFTRKPLMVAAVCIGFAGSLLSLLEGGNFTLLLTGLAARGFAYSFIMGVGNAMASDTVEYGQWKTGVRTQGVLMSSKGLGDKLSVGFLMAVIGWVMGYAGYDGALEVQPESAVNAIRGFFLYTPFILFIIITVMLLFYKLDKQYPQIIRELNEREALSSESN